MICCVLTVCVLRFTTLAFLLHSVRIPCALFIPILRFGVVGLFGRVLFVIGCLKGFHCTHVFLWVGGFLLVWSQGFRNGNIGGVRFSECCYRLGFVGLVGCV